MTPASFLITGGAGFLGINLCRHLLAQGHIVRSMDIAPFAYPERGAVQEMQADIRDKEAVEAAMRGMTYVVHCAAALPRSSREEILSTNIEGTRILLECAQRLGIARFVYISSTAVYGIPDHHPILEGDRLDGVGPYGQSKIEAERHCAVYREAGLCLPVLRPKTFVGPERLGVFGLLYDWAYSGRNFPVLGSGNNRYQLLDVEDLCVAIALCCSAHADSVNDTFNIGAREFGSLRDSFQAVLDRAGHGKHVVSLPLRPAIAALRVLEALRLSPLYEWVYETAATESFVSTERLTNCTGFATRHSARDALIRNFDWYVAHRREFLGTSGVTHRVPWKTGALQLAKYFF
ncbi:MAG: NAD-dependent epimerase/dehydratase family protein [Steroidobacterales bacterium]